MLGCVSVFCVLVGGVFCICVVYVVVVFVMVMDCVEGVCSWW